jgi:hypothetical protein
MPIAIGTKLLEFIGANDIMKRFKILKIGIFILITIFLYCKISDILVYTEPVTTRILEGFYDLEEDTVDVIFMGPSLIYNGISPLDIYEDTGIVSYNLATPAQEIELTYYLLKDALKMQSPKLVVLDINQLFKRINDGENYNTWSIDNMPYGENKFYMAEIQAEKLNQSIIFYLFPLLRDHTRWSDLTSTDFTSHNKLYYSKGFWSTPNVRTTDIDISKMNEIEEYIHNDIISNTTIYSEYNIENIEQYDNYYEDDAYDEMDEERLGWLDMIDELCSENGIELLLIKMPVIQNPITRKGSWTYNRYCVAKEFAQNNLYNYVDLIYDSGIDWDTELDFQDFSGHCNIFGAEKASEYVGKYLLNNYPNIASGSNDDYDSDLELYKYIRQILKLECETDLTKYFERLNNMDNITLFLSGYGDATYNKSEKLAELINSVGFKADFNNMPLAYTGIVSNGISVFEESSNRPIEISGNIYDMDIEYKLNSTDYYHSSNASISINGVEYVNGNYGLNMVVYDNVTNLVIDSVYFRNENVIRNYTSAYYYFTAYEKAIAMK